jgi:hypothetical protein|tara:strand:+ start:682 stop:942 length:261 start_codon:yes stop_codon:yes gene_type:complete
MIDANKYIDRLRQTVKYVKSFKNDGRRVSFFTVKKRFEYLLNRCSDILRDYDMDFSKAMEEMEDEGTRRGRETAEYLKQLTDKKDV